MIKLLKRFLLIAIILFAMLLVAKLFIVVVTKQAEKYAQRVNANKVTEISWTPFHSVIGNFKAVFPDTPGYDHAEIPILDGKISTVYDTYAAEDPDNDFYTITVVQYPPEVVLGNTDEVIEKVMNEIINETPGNELLEFHPVIGDKGVSGFDFIVQSGDYSTHYRALIDFRTLYILSVASSDVDTKKTCIKRFLEGFKILV